MMRPYGRRTNNPPELLSHFIDHTTAAWDITKPEEFCLPIDIPSIIQIPLCSSNIPECWAWNLEKSGLFTIRSTYRMMVETKFRRGAWLDCESGLSSSDRDANSWKLL